MQATVRWLRVSRHPRLIAPSDRGHIVAVSGLVGGGAARTVRSHLRNLQCAKGVPGGGDRWMQWLLLLFAFHLSLLIIGVTKTTSVYRCRLFVLRFAVAIEPCPRVKRTCCFVSAI